MSTINWCFECGNGSKLTEPCPVCGREPNSLNLSAKTTKELNAFVSSIENVKIPKEYQGVEWSKETLLTSHASETKDLHFLRFASQLEKLHNIFVDKRIPSKSAIIIAPPQFSKETFAYSCMQFALSNGYKVGKLLDTIELKRLLVLASENPKYSLYGTAKQRGIDYDEYMTSEVLFVTVTKTQFAKEASSVIMEMLDRRARLGFPTFFLSRYRLNELAWPNKLEEFEAIIDKNDTENSLKYPVILSYRKEFI